MAKHTTQQNRKTYSIDKELSFVLAQIALNFSQQIGCHVNRQDVLDACIQALDDSLVVKNKVLYFVKQKHE